MKVRRILMFVPIAVATLLGLFLWKGLSIDPTVLPSALIGKPFPEFKLTELQDATQPVTRSDLLTGKPVLVNVWATWCPSCKLEHPELLRIARQEGIAIFGIDYKDDRAAALNWVRQYQNPYEKIIFDPEGTLGFNLGVYGAPETYILDAQGVVRFRYAGPVNDAVWQEMKAIIQTLGTQG